LSVLTVIVDIAAVLLVTSLVALIIRSRGQAGKVNIALLIVVGILIMGLVSMGKLITGLLVATIVLGGMLAMLFIRRIV